MKAFILSVLFGIIAVFSAVTTSYASPSCTQFDVICQDSGGNDTSGGASDGDSDSDGDASGGDASDSDVGGDSDSDSNGRD